MMSGTHLDSTEGNLVQRSRQLVKSVARMWGLADQGVYYNLVVAFGLFFVLPTLGFLDFAYKYDFFTDRYLAYFFLGVLIFSYLGFFILRSLADQIRRISEKVEGAVTCSHPGIGQENSSELKRIVASFQQLLERLEQSSQSLEQKSHQLRLLGELAAVSGTAIGSESFLKHGLKKACEGTGAGDGWILLLDESRRHHFKVAAAVGENQGKRWRPEKEIPFNRCRASQAVLEGRPLFFSDRFQQEMAASSSTGPQPEGADSLIVPLLSGPDTIGAIWLARKAGGASFCSADSDYLLALASCLASCWEGRQLRDLAACQSGQLNCLAYLIRLCNLGLLRGRVFQQVASELRRFVPVKLTFLAIFDRRQEYLEIVEIESEEPVSLHRGVRLPVRQTLFSQVLQENQELYREQLRENLHPVEARLFRELGVNCCYLAPFRARGINAGVLFIGSNSIGGISGPQRIILQQVGGLMGLATHAQLLMQEVDEQSQQLETLNRAGRVLASSPFDLETVLDQLTALIDRLILVEMGVVYLRQDDTLVARRTFGSLGSRLEPESLSPDDGIVAYVTSRAESLLVRDVWASPHLSLLLKGPTPTKVRSLLCVPITADREVVGLIYLCNKEYDSFSTQDEKLLRSMAAYFAVAVKSQGLLVS